MTIDEAETIINAYGAELSKAGATAKDTIVLRESSLPYSKPMIKQAFFTYISELCSFSPGFLQDNYKHLLGAYSHLNDFVDQDKAQELQEAKDYIFDNNGKDIQIMSRWTSYVSSCLTGDENLYNELLVFMKETTSKK
jgi:hypothetical protein